jgi:hypothetical protein
MGLEFSFDDVSLDQQVSGDQLEIDLYDELITISDAEPDEQVRLLSARPQATGYRQDDKAESIRVTGSLARGPASGGLAMPDQIIPAQDDPFAAAPPPNSTRPRPLPGPSPVPRETRPQVPPTPLPTPPAVAGQRPAQPIQPEFSAPIPAPKTREMTPPGTLHQQPAPQPPRVQRPPSSVSAPGSAAPVVSAETPGNKCQDCGQPAGDLDMICIECGAFLG